MFSKRLLITIEHILNEMADYYEAMGFR